jgi:subtilisin family serine protease
VRFVITSPRKSDSVPTAIYFVEADKRMDEVVLVSPGASEAVPYAPVAFSWEKKVPAAAYLIECLENRNERVVFSAYARENAYVLPEAVLQAAFAAGETYRWRVKALDGEGRIVAESGLRMLRLVEPDVFVPGQVLTVLGERDFSEALLKELEGKYGLSVLDVFPLKSIGVMTILFRTGGKDVLNTAQELSRDRRFMSVQPNYISSTSADSLAGANYASGLMQVEKLHVSLKGRGIRVAVIDTGVDTDHPNLAGRVTLSKNFVRGESSAPEIHGTAVAGIIAAQGGSGIRGIAPEAEILGLRACRQIARERPQGECFSDSLARALDEAILQKAQVVNMSFGSPANDPLALRLLEKGAEQGILFVASAGNNPNDRDLRFPASLPVVVSVSGFDEKLRPYPNEEIGKKTSVSAPAVNIITTVPGNRHNFLTGTSFSSAYVSGLLALALEKDRALTRQRIPVSRGNLCVWEEELLKIALCGK